MIDKLKKFLFGFKYAAEGIISAVKSERNMKVHLCATVLVVLAGLIFHISVTEWLVCIGWICAVICAEMLNTAIEAITDIVMPHPNPLAKKAKDVAAGAVLVLAIGAAVSGLIIFIPYLLHQ